VNPKNQNLEYDMNEDFVLNTLCDGLPDDDIQALREERAAILEYCGGFSRYEAERRTGLAGSSRLDPSA